MNWEGPAAALFPQGELPDCGSQGSKDVSKERSWFCGVLQWGEIIQIVQIMLCSVLPAAPGLLSAAEPCALLV